MRDVLSWEETSVMIFVAGSKGVVRGRAAYCDYGIVFHEALLGASKQAQEGEDERRSAQHYGDQGTEAHTVLCDGDNYCA